MSETSPARSMQDRPAAQPSSQRTQTRRIVVAGAVGTAVEYYDFGVYGFLATTLAGVFFPQSDDVAGLLATLAVFALAFFVRPLGGIVFGHVGDRLGRRKALALTILCMSGATVLIGALPSYAAIGVAAPILLLTMRVVQGMSAGGEIGGATSYVAESSSDRRRGILCSTTELGSMIGLLSASAMVATVTWALPADALQSWGWRIPFLLSLPLGVVGLYIRSRLADSPAFQDLESKKQVVSIPIVEVLRKHRAGVLRVIGINVLASPGYYMAFVYSSIYLQREGGFSGSAAAWSTTATLIAATLVIPLFGHISDLCGRKIVLGSAAVAFLALAYPMFALMRSDVVGLAVLGQVVLGLVEGAIMGALMATLAEQFDTKVRYTGLSLGYNIGASIFGGTAPFAATWLIAGTGNPLSPAFLLIGTAVVTIVTVALLRESHRRPLPA